jgi:hypothetical protein
MGLAGNGGSADRNMFEVMRRPSAKREDECMVQGSSIAFIARALLLSAAVVLATTGKSPAADVDDVNEKTMNEIARLSALDIVGLDSLGVTFS